MRRSCRRPPARAGLSLVEALVALMMLSAGFGALLSLSTGETQRVDLSRQRLLADRALRQLSESLRPALVEELQEFPPTLAAFDGNPLYRSIIAEMPGIATPEDPTRAALAQAFEDALEADGIRRAVLFQPGTGPSDPGLVTYVVRYQGPDGEDRVLEATRTIYDN